MAWMPLAACCEDAVTAARATNAARSDQVRARGARNSSCTCGGAAACHPDAPDTLVDPIPDHNSTVMSRVDCNTDVAVYFDSGLRQIPSTETAWLSPFITDVWRYLKQEYGSCAVPRTLPAPIGQGCDSFGAPNP
jgi:hypothetical protein